MKRKIILGVSLFLLLLTLFALSISGAEPVEAWDISATSSDSVTAYLYDAPSKSGYYDMVISGTGNMGHQYDTRSPWYESYKDKIISVTVEDGVRNIGDYAFYYCSAIVSVDFLGDIYTIGSYAFNHCTSLKKISIPNGISSIGSKAFAGCSQLEEFEIQSGTSVSTVSGEWLFDGNCYNLKKISIYKHVGKNFLSCLQNSSKLCELTLYDINFSEQLSSGIARNDYPLGYVFGFTHNADTCLKVTQNYLQYRILFGTYVDTSSTFCIPTSLKKVTVLNGAIRSGAFSNLNLDTVVLGKGVTMYADAFAGNPNLTIYCEAESQPNNWSSSWNYSNCPVVWNCYIDGWDISANSDGSVMAYLEEIAGKEGYYTLTVSGQGEMKNWTSYVNVPWFSSYRDKIMSVVIEDGVTTIGDYAFCNLSSTTSVSIGNSITTVGNFAFYACNSLTSVELPDSVASIGKSAFYSCKFLTSLVIPNGVTSIGESAFSGCNSITSIVIGNGVAVIGSYAFYNCNSLTIYCVAESQPSGWSSNWNSSNRPVVWGYIAKEATLGEIFTFLGYSFNEEGSMAVGFEINYEALKKYEEKTGEKLEIGVVFAGYSLLNGNQPLDAQGNAITLDDGAVVKFDLTEYDYTYYDFVITDIVDSIKDIDLVISAYINNGYENKYVQENGISDTVTGISYNEAKA